MPSMKERMQKGEWYLAYDPEIRQNHARTQAVLMRYNATTPDEADVRHKLLRDLLADVGERVVVEPPFRCDYGEGITIGDGTFVNWDCIMLDGAPISIGRCCQLGPRVQLLTATHPIDPGPRRLGWERAVPVSIGDNVWLGGGVIVCPGVSIGENTVVGAGAVVSRDLPDGVVAVGGPARVVRAIGPKDRVRIPDS